MAPRPCPRFALALVAAVLAPALPGAQTWTMLAATGPAPRRNAAAVYDPKAHRVVLFGGRGSAGDLNDVWALDLAGPQWRQITPRDGPVPSPRFTHNAVYDPEGHRALVWAGRNLSAAGSALFNDVWAFDLTEERWQLLEPTTPAPERRYGTAAVFDPRAGTLVTFAGFTEAGRFDDTWRFDPRTREWRDVSPASGQPGERCLHAAAYDEAAHRMVIFGGQRGDSALQDAWAFDLRAETWRELPPASAAGGRRFPAGAYDPAADRFVFFGGEADGARFGDLWVLDLSFLAWSRLAGDGPEPRDGAVMVYVPDGRLVLFGGTGSQHLADTWTYPLETAPTAVSDGRPDPEEGLGLAAFPNPFNDSVRLDLTAPVPARLTICDLLGQPVYRVAAFAGAQQLAWDGTDDEGRRLASGVYLAVLRAGSQTRSARLLLAR